MHALGFVTSNVTANITFLMIPCVQLKDANTRTANISYVPLSVCGAVIYCCKFLFKFPKDNTLPKSFIKWLFSIAK